MEIRYLIIFSLLLQSCVFNERESACPVEESDEIRVYYNYTQAGIDPTSVKSLTLYVFDNNGKYVTSKTESVILSNNYFTSLVLDTGKYIFTVWGNLKAPYYTLPANFVEGITNINDASLNLRRPLSNSITTVLPPLFFGRTHDTIKRVQKITIPLVQNTNKINLTVEGIRPVDDDYRFIITDNNSKYNFDNSFAPDAEFDYINSLTKTGNDLTSSLTVLRLDGTRKVKFDIFNATKQTSAYNHDLIDIIKKLHEADSQVDWINTHQFDIVVVFTPTGVNVSINGWQVIENETPIG